MSLMYLEDFLQYTDELPQIFRDSLTKIRTLDLELNNRQDHAKRLTVELAKMKRERGKSDDAETDDKAVQMTAEVEEELNKVVQLGVDKLRTVWTLEQVMQRFNTRLEGDTDKFKMEIEADNPGCTIKLETRALEEMTGHLKPPTSVDFDVPHSCEASSSNIALAPSGTSAVGILYPEVEEMLQSEKEVDGIVQTSPLANRRDRFLQRVTVPTSDSPFLVPTTTSGRYKRAIPASSHTFEDEEDEDKQYCFCGQRNGGRVMIACDNGKRCKTEWFHAECVRIKNVERIRQRAWYCPDCLAGNSLGSIKGDLMNLKERKSR
ncbi:hypothetical protein RvY_12163 [Ramazzottius varieornatus]|uniref:Inhibitor of growth protein n=1 Tax=Ramazzottius varieornatus TaxID=947166 RepID=A0A1D1VMT2_RAMVA|nr:hypothetical protein RvY_12163 [Ramazzottius varieornatus]